MFNLKGAKHYKVSVATGEGLVIDSYDIGILGSEAYEEFMTGEDSAKYDVFDFVFTPKDLEVNFKNLDIVRSLEEEILVSLRNALKPIGKKTR